MWCGFCLWRAYIQIAERTNRHEQWTAEDVKNCVEYIRYTEETQKRVDKEGGRVERDLRKGGRSWSMKGRQGGRGG